ncbi:MAG: hypothetical protein AB7S68_18880 [Polyangiaceae bacterium]
MDEILPAGEWKDWEFLKADGLMTRQAGAVHARATRIRTGEVLHLKAVPARGESANSTTRDLASRPQLLELKERLVRVCELQVPTVPIRYVDFLMEPPWLVVGMEPVTVLSNTLSEAVPRSDLAWQVLETLNFKACDGWYHWDICPRNAGITLDGKVVFLDLDSFYPLDSPPTAGLKVQKDWRTPAYLQRIRAEAGERRSITLRDAQTLHDAGVLLLAAECELGEFDRRELSQSEAELWVHERPVGDEIKTFWSEHLSDLCRGQQKSWDEIVRLLKSRPRTNDSPRTPSRRPGASTARLGPQSLKGNFRELQRDLRLRRLRASQIEGYRTGLEREVSRDPRLREHWVELLMITLTFLPDYAKAYEFAERALEHFPKDKEFERDLQMAKRWNR